MRVTQHEETDTAVIVLREAGPDTVGEIAGEDLHKDDAGELYRIEIFSRASERLDLDRIYLQRVPAEVATQEEARVGSNPV